MRRSIPLAFSIAAVLGMNSLYADTIFCVHDQDLNDSQLCAGGNFAEDTPTPSLHKMGPLHKDCDIEALDVVYDPGDIYAASGDDTPRPGRLYRVNRVNSGGGTGPVTGLTLDDLGGVYYTNADDKKIKLEEIDALSADPDDGVLWGWSQGQGLFRIMAPPYPPSVPTYDPLSILPVHTDVKDCTTADPTNDFVVEAEMVIETDDPTEIEDIEWNEDGEVLYGVENVHSSEHDVDDHGPVDYEDGVRLWAYYQSSGTIEAVCMIDFNLLVATADSVLPSTVPVLEGEIEGLDSLPRSFFDVGLDTDTLLLTFHGRTSLSFVVITTPSSSGDSCGIESYGTLTADDFNDIEGIAYGPTVSF